MSKYEDEFALLENTTGRVIYYSCIAEPKTIPEIADLWGYKTSTYFYQKTTKKLIESMENEGLISFIKGRGGGISSNYDLVINKEGTISFFKRLNDEVSAELILSVYDWEIEREQLENQMFREYCIDKKEGLRDRVRKIMFGEKDIEHFISLWKDDLFKNIFLSADFIKTLFNERRNLPQDPREFLYGLTLSVCEDISADEYEDEDFSINLNPYRVIYLDDESYRVLNSKIEPMSSLWRSPKQRLKLSRITTRIEDITKILVQKLEAYPEEMEGERPQLRKFIQKMGFWAE